MKMLSAFFTLVLATFGVAAGASGPSWTAPVCSAGVAGDHPAGMDSDGDGVPDSEDWCPNSKAGDKVNANGCAVWEIPVACRPVAVTSAPEPVRVVPADTPPPAPVLAAPEPEPQPVAAVLPVDSDGDGVPDSRDKCPGTPLGTAVDADGCAVISKVVLKGVNFDTGSAVLKPAASATLDSVASAMKANPKVKAEIGGYTDNKGNAKKNIALSERRAKAVKAYLVKHGVEAKRLLATGYGAADPVDTNETPAGRANNRRVAFKEVD